MHNHSKIDIPMKIFYTLSLCFVLTITAYSQDDSTRVAQLTKYGQKYQRGKAILWVYRDSLSVQRINEILDTLNLGISKANKFIHAPMPWQKYADAPVTFFLCNDDFVPHASVDGFVFMPLRRFTNNKALWLHEAMHILLRSKKGNWNEAPQHVTVEKMPMWLTEGLPEYIAIKLSHDNGFYRYDAWRDGGYLRVDSSCAIKLRGDNGAPVLNYIGRPGVMLELFGKSRPVYAPTFYNCSCSFTKYLVERFGIESLLKAIAEFGNEEKTFENLTSENLETLKKAWLLKSVTRSRTKGTPKASSQGPIRQGPANAPRPNISDGFQKLPSRARVLSR
jgi:hypothetical protein